MEPESSSPHLQELSTCAYAEPDQFSPHHPIRSLQDPLKNVYSPACSVPPPSDLTSCTPTKSNLYFNSSFDTVTSEPALYKHLTFHVFRRLGSLSKEFVQVRGSYDVFETCLFFTVRVCKLHAQPPSCRTTLCRLYAVAYSMYSQLPSIAGGRSSIRYPRWRHAVVTRDPPDPPIFWGRGVQNL
jgi:hypothetical protein